jgi:hypothetical protein
LPQHCTPPLAVRAQVCAPPAATAAKRVAGPTGVGLFVVVPFPSCPERFSPQHNTVPVEERAHVWYPPAAIAATPEPNPETPTGTELFLVVPFPSWPEVFNPQQSTPPPAVRAHEWETPVDTAATPEPSPDTLTGVELPFNAPFPS